MNGAVLVILRKPFAISLASSLSESSSVVVDLGAGTGKLTKALAPIVGRIIAVEPVDAMREKLSTLHPQIEVRNGTAESIPLLNSSADAVVVGQAFHWFDGERALDEIHRVLKEDGSLGLIWNLRDESVPWVARLTEIINPYAMGAPRYRSGEWKKAFLRTMLFTPLEEANFSFVHPTSSQDWMDLVASFSSIAMLPEEQRLQVLNQIQVLLASHPLTRGQEQINSPYRTDVFWCRKIKRPSTRLRGR